MSPGALTVADWLLIIAAFLVVVSTFWREEKFEIPTAVIISSTAVSLCIIVIALRHSG